jgi:hypothetical protein
MTMTMGETPDIRSDMLFDIAQLFLKPKPGAFQGTRKRHYHATLTYKHNQI